MKDGTRSFKFNDIHVSYPPDMSRAEALSYLDEVPKELDKKYPLTSLTITYSAGDVMLWPHYDTVVRIRRITGYMSRVPNFNEAKKAELAARTQHISNE